MRGILWYSSGSGSTSLQMYPPISWAYIIKITEFFDTYLIRFTSIMHVSLLSAELWNQCLFTIYVWGILSATVRFVKQHVLFFSFFFFDTSIMRYCDVINRESCIHVCTVCVALVANSRYRGSYQPWFLYESKPKQEIYTTH